MTALSVQKHTIALGAGVFSNTAELTGNPDVDMCVPFTQTRVTAASSAVDSFRDYTVRAEFVAGPPKEVQLTIAGDNASRAVTCEVSVVQFDPAHFNVYKGTATFTNDDDVVTVTDAFGAGPVTVDQSKAFLYFTFASLNSQDLYFAHAIRGKIGDGLDTGTASTVVFNCAISLSALEPTAINWWVVEAKGTEWSVQTADIQLLDTETSISAAITAVTPGKTFIFGSHTVELGGNGDAPFGKLIDIDLTGANDQITATRRLGEGQLDWHGYAVSFDAGGGDVVYRDTLAWAAAEASKTDVTITGGPVSNTDNCIVHMAGQTGTFGGGDWATTPDESYRAPNAMTAWTFTSTSALTVTRSVIGSADSGANLTWEVIEWDVGGAPPATPASMVVCT